MKNRRFTALFWILVSTLFVVTSLTIASSYLNTSMINMARHAVMKLESY